MKKTHAEVKRLLDVWPAMTTALDRVALIILESESEAILRQIVERDFDATYDYAGCLNFLFWESVRRIPSCVAEFAFSPESEGASVSELMDDARKEFDVIKTLPRTRNLAGLWQARINQGVHVDEGAVWLAA